MYAIVDIAGQQYKVEKDQKIFVHRLQDKEGSKVSFKKILLLDDGKNVKIGSPNLDGASVDAKVISHLKDDKVIVFKKKRRKGYRVKNGHRQLLSEIQISNISSSGSKVKTKALETKIDVKSETNSKAKQKKVTKVKAPKEDFSSMSVTDLKNMAKEKGLTGISKMKKADLIKALS
ncbi:MAG: 50S ribosomal protein L21 [Flavobacteriaceae bacterium]|nr:50S ribosomal protein L21 [Flavobacteriaceae bacterium]|tara:strand:+ start:7003 stop:7530 length:528 start_codon:yes stop_codon:yes gene_type:complete